MVRSLWSLCARPLMGGRAAPPPRGGLGWNLIGPRPLTGGQGTPSPHGGGGTVRWGRGDWRGEGALGRRGSASCIALGFGGERRVSGRAGVP